MALRKKIYSIINDDGTGGRINLLFEYFIIGLIVLNVVAITLESIHDLHAEYQFYFLVFEYFSIVVFSIEYLMRIVTADFKYPSKPFGKALISYIFSPIALIDLIAIVPAFLPLLVPMDLRFVRIMRILRMMRIFKFSRYSKSMKLFRDVLYEKRGELGVTAFTTVVLLIVSSTLMYFLERDDQPDAFPNILASFWWAVATLTTVGYGDVYPVTAAGKFISGIIALMGVGLVALPTGILSSAFMDKVSEQKQTKNTDGICPTCGAPLKEHQH